MSKIIASVLSEFASEFRSVDIPSGVRTAAKMHIADSLGACIAAAKPESYVVEAARRIAERRPCAAGSTLFGLGRQCSAELAALLNGLLTQALEMDDKHGPSLARPGSTVVPAAMAIGEEHGLTMGEVITSVVVGYEVMIRLGFVAGARFLERGYHTSSLIGGFGAVAAVGRLLEFESTTIAHALGIVGTFAAGIQEATRKGSTSKALHGGWGAHCGIIASELASSGITGPDTVFEGFYGFFRAHLTPIEGDLNWLAATESLGSRWYLPQTAFKPYPCCQLLHSFIEGAKQIREELASDACPLEAVEEIVCRLAEPGLTLVTQPEQSKRSPQSAQEARFSLPYVVATTLVDGDISVTSFRDKSLSNQQVLALANKVTWGEDAESDYPLHDPAKVEVVASGKTYRRHIRFHPGCPEAPLSKSDVLRKFERNTRWLLRDRAFEVGATLMDLDEDEPVREVVALLQGPSRSGAMAR